MKILVTGGAGYIGSHAVKALLDHQHDVTVLDNLSHGHQELIDPRAHFIQGPTEDKQLLIQIFSQRRIEAVMHFAANIEVAESVSFPHKYYQNNFTSSLTLLKAMVETGVKKIVFSSTAAVYGHPEKVPIEETQIRNPINPYGRSKMMTEMAIEDFTHAYGIGHVILRYFNVAGASCDSSLGEDHQPETHLIPRILAAAYKNEEIRIYGTDYPTRDGTCVRDYIHVLDLVKAHILAVETLRENKGSIYNIGSEHGFSVRAVIKACEKATQRSIKVKESPRRPGDPAILIANIEKVRRELHWRPDYPSIDTIVEHAWSWYLHRFSLPISDSPAAEKESSFKI